MSRRESTDRPTRHRVVFNTADPNPSGAAYGGGAGGYGRWVSVLLSNLSARDIDLVPCFQSARKTGRFYKLAFPYRLVADLVRLIRAARSADVVHMTLQYRLATPREFLSVLALRMLQVPVLADIRAGQFVSWYSETNPLYRWMAGYVVKSASAVAVEGISYVAFLRETFGVDATYCPMAVASAEIPSETPERCVQAPMKLLFVGYCYDGKGVKELVTGAREAAEAGQSLVLTLVGEEHEDFATWLDDFDTGNLQVARLGRRPHREVLELMLEHDVFCMPTRHPGEGHPNVINEAMMMGMVIVCTRHGFLENVLTEDGCYFVERESPRAIAGILRRIASAPEEARRRAALARDRVRSQFTSDAVVPIVEAIYRRLISAQAKPTALEGRSV